MKVEGGKSRIHMYNIYELYGCETKARSAKNLALSITFARSATDVSSLLSPNSLSLLLDRLFAC